MAWIGWTVGMSGPTVKTAKEILKRKYKSYAGNLDDTEVFGTDLQMVLAEYQGRRNAEGWTPALRLDGVLDYNTQDSLGMISHAAAPKKVVVFTVQGAGVDMWTGPPADTARAILDLIEWQPIGNYPAAQFPMTPSVNDGIRELRVQIRKWATARPDIKMALVGYSEGSLVTGSVWKHDIEPEGGMLHDLKDRFVVGVTWGFPARELGKANGNVYAGWPVPTGQGIVDDRLVGTPDYWYDFAHGANSQWGRDLYTDTPADATGKDETAIWHIVASVDFFSQGSLIPLLITALGKPESAILPILTAVLQAGMFFVVKGLTPHTDYDITPAVNLLRSKFVAL